MSKTRKLMFEMHASDSGEKTYTVLQFRGLMMIDEHPGITVGELAEKFFMSSASIAQYLNRLANAKLINKRIDKVDKRIFRIYLSSAGKKKLKKMQEGFYSKIRDLLSPLTKAELEEYIRIHRKLLINLEQRFSEAS